MKIFLICGYGIPKDIHEDQNYLTYLNSVFNKIYQNSVGEAAAIIPCGGSTSCEPPYLGTEAEAITEYFSELKNREYVKERMSAWQIYPETESLSSLENLLFAKKIIEEKSLTGFITIFCEFTRLKRIKKTAEKIFVGFDFVVEAIDFDFSKNRYRDPVIIKEKEDLAEQEALWTLEDPERIVKHHELFEKKFAFFRERQAQGIAHVDVVKEWFEKGPVIMKELMPEHPLFK